MSILDKFLTLFPKDDKRIIVRRRSSAAAGSTEEEAVCWSWRKDQQHQTETDYYTQPHPKPPVLQNLQNHHFSSSSSAEQNQTYLIRDSRCGDPGDPEPEGRKGCLVEFDPSSSSSGYNMFVARNIKTEHKDLIHDVAYDFYGTRMATCSSDQTVRIWEVDNGTGNWTCTASWKAHSGSVWKVTWANPEFGQVIATCSFDRTAAVWEEVVGEGNIGDRASLTHWVKRTTLVDSRTSVTDVKFAPKYLGLVLASCSADGFVRIYEAPDVMNLTQWSLQYELSVKFSCSCIAWNPTYPRHFAPIIAVGSDDTLPDTPKVLVYEFNENLRRWNKIESLADVQEPVNDISFAPNLGRSHHMLGIASKDLKIISLEPQGTMDDDNQGSTKYIVRTVATCTEHSSTVWRVAWNVTGTILASSGDDGCVRLWKGNYVGNWKLVSILRGDGTQGNTEAGASASSTSPYGSPTIPPIIGTQGPNTRFAKLGDFGLKSNVVWH